MLNENKQTIKLMLSATWKFKREKNEIWKHFKIVFGGRMIFLFSILQMSFNKHELLLRLNKKTLSL